MSFDYRCIGQWILVFGTLISAVVEDFQLFGWTMIGASMGHRRHVLVIIVFWPHHEIPVLSTLVVIWIGSHQIEIVVISWYNRIRLETHEA